MQTWNVENNKVVVDVWPDWVWFSYMNDLKSSWNHDVQTWFKHRKSLSGSDGETVKHCMCNTKHHFIVLALNRTDNQQEMLYFLGIHCLWFWSSVLFLSHILLFFLCEHICVSSSVWWWWWWWWCESHFWSRMLHILYQIFYS